MDNGADSKTELVTRQMQAADVPITYLPEPQKGKGYAYNKGISSAHGDILLFTDDDVCVPENWISGMCEPILSGAFDAIQGGIKVAPHLERPWLTGALRMWVAAVDDPLVPPEGLVGANMAFTKKAAKSAGPFDHRLGPGASGFFDDTVYGWSLKKLGFRIGYVPMVSVIHEFNPGRLNLRSYLQIAERMASSRVLVEQDWDLQIEGCTMYNLLVQFPGLLVSSFTQAFWYVGRGYPDQSFVFRYYRLRLWLARRAGRSIARQSSESPTPGKTSRL